jgi:hypothetical protein
MSSELELEHKLELIPTGTYRAVLKSIRRTTFERTKEPVAFLTYERIESGPKDQSIWVLVSTSPSSITRLFRAHKREIKTEISLASTSLFYRLFTAHKRPEIKTKISLAVNFPSYRLSEPDWNRVIEEVEGLIGTGANISVSHRRFEGKMFMHCIAAANPAKWKHPVPSLSQKQIAAAVEDDKWQIFRLSLKGLSTEEKLRRLKQYLEDDKWQIFRLSLKGLSTEKKLRLLEQYLEEKTSSIDNIERGMREIRVANYINALRRGGLLNDKYEVVYP